MLNQLRNILKELTALVGKGERGRIIGKCCEARSRERFGRHKYRRPLLCTIFSVGEGVGRGGVLHRFLSLAAVEANYANKILIRGEIY